MIEMEVCETETNVPHLPFIQRAVAFYLNKCAQWLQFVFACLWLCNSSVNKRDLSLHTCDNLFSVRTSPCLKNQACVKLKEHLTSWLSKKYLLVSSTVKICPVSMSKGGGHERNKERRFCCNHFQQWFLSKVVYSILCSFCMHFIDLHSRKKCYLKLKQFVLQNYLCLT